MIQRTKKRVLLTTIITAILIIAMIIAGVFIIGNKNNKEAESLSSEIANLNFETKSLIVKTTGEVKNNYNAISVKELMKNMYLLKYETEDDAINAYKKLKKDKTIEYVAPDSKYEVNKVKDYVITLSDIEQNNYTSWGGTAMGADVLQTYIRRNLEAPAIKVAVIDSGIDENMKTTFTQFATFLEGYNIIDENNDVTDEDGHGTSMTYAILDAGYPNINILPIKVLDNEGRGDFADIISGISYAVEQGADVINLSLGSDTKNAAAIAPLVTEAINQATTAGVIVVAAAGNGDDDGVGLDMDVESNKVYPACVQSCITVGSVKNNLIQFEEVPIEGEDHQTALQISNEFEEYAKPTMEDLTLSSFSNYGDIVDFVTPGECILAVTKDGYMSWADGTSPACAYMSGIVADVLSYNKDFTNDEVYEILQYYASDLGTEGKDKYYGNGFINFNNAQECTCACEDCNKIYCFNCDCDDCLYHAAPEKVLESIEITNNPSKMTYTEGEKFDKSGMVVTAIYNNESREIVTDYTYSPIEELTLEDTTITVDYQGQQATLEITVNPKPAKTLRSIAITTNPSKMIYTEGEKFDKSGMVVEATYSDMSSEEISDYTYSPIEELTTHDTIITVDYQGQQATLEITVNPKPAKVLQSIAITTNPSKMTYTEGEKFDKSGMVVKATYDDASSEEITDYTYSPIEELTTHDTTITVTYQGKQAKLTIIVKEEEVQPEKPKLDRIQITKMPNKTTYTEGEKFDPTGMEVTAVYSDGTTKVVTTYNCFPTTNLTKANNIATISYTEDGVTASTTISIVVNEKNQGGNTGNPSGGNSGNQGENTGNPSGGNSGNQGGNTGNPSSGNSGTQGGSTGNPSSGNSGTQGGSTGNPSSGNQANTAVDNSTKDGSIAYTGAESYIMPLIIIVVIIGTIGFIKYRQYKDI